MTSTLPTVPEDAEYELERWGTKFVRAGTERAYVVWQCSRTMRFNRAAIYAALGGLGMGTAALVWIRPTGLGPILGAGAVLAVLSVTLLVMTYRPRLFTWVHPAVAFVNGLFGVTVVASYSLLDAVELSVGGALLTTFFAFAVNRTRPAHATLAVAAYALLAEVLLVRAVSVGRLPIGWALLESVTLGTAFGTGVMIALVIDAEGRATYRQERIIEAQKLTIARERARSESLLKQELSHQVAERSRELGAVLARSDVTLDVRRLSPGERFDARYRIVAALGAGGMGAVYEVERLTDGATLALKAVVGEVSGASAARFAREAEIGARIHHPNLVSIVDVGVSAGVPFLVMELVRGGSLESQRVRFGDVPWALPILGQIAEGLAALHDAGVVHRDLKPANVLLATGDEAGAGAAGGGGRAPASTVVAKISDFGISRFGALDDAAASIDPNAATVGPPSPRPSALTGTGMVMGTPLYMAPEAARGGRAVDAPADVFALGIIAYEMLTGRAPFAVPAVMLAMAEQPIPVAVPIDDARIPAPLRVLILDCLGSDPTKRPRVRGVLAELGSARRAAGAA